MAYTRRPKVDSAGTEIKKGQIVACNVSGQIGKGEVTHVGQQINVKLTEECAGFLAGHVSRIKNGYSVLVLEETRERSCPNCGQFPV